MQLNLNHAARNSNPLTYNPDLIANIAIVQQHNSGNTDNSRAIYSVAANLSILNSERKYTVSRGGGKIEQHDTFQEPENKRTTENYELTAEQQTAFDRSFKMGIYKQLHRKGLLTDTQLNEVLKIQI